MKTYLARIAALTVALSALGSTPAIAQDDGIGAPRSFGTLTQRTLANPSSDPGRRLESVTVDFRLIRTGEDAAVGSVTGTFTFAARASTRYDLGVLNFGRLQNGVCNVNNLEKTQPYPIPQIAVGGTMPPTKVTWSPDGRVASFTDEHTWTNDIAPDCAIAELLDRSLKLDRLEGPLTIDRGTLEPRSDSRLDVVRKRTSLAKLTLDNSGSYFGPATVSASGRGYRVPATALRFGADPVTVGLPVRLTGRRIPRRILLTVANALGSKTVALKTRRRNFVRVRPGRYRDRDVSFTVRKRRVLDYRIDPTNTRCAGSDNRAPLPSGPIYTLDPFRIYANGRAVGSGKPPDGSIWTALRFGFDSGSGYLHSVASRCYFESKLSFARRGGS